MISLIYEEEFSIRQAALRCNISYPTAKAINRIYLVEKRVDKKQSRARLARVTGASAASYLNFEADGDYGSKAIRNAGKDTDKFSSPA